MKKNNNNNNKNKGFTLVELLVCITILGIITMMSIPIIRNITVNNSSTKYNSYLETVINAAKLYVDSYGEDLFGNNEVGCNYISLRTLKEKKLIKDYDESGITCDTASTFVQVNKFEDSYSYVGYLGCADTSDTTNLIYTLPNNDGSPNLQDPTVCAGVDSSNTISVTVEPGSYNGTTKKNVNVKINVSGIAGVRRNSAIKFKWSTSNVDFNTNGMQIATFNDVPTEEVQREMLSAGNIISLDSVEITTPAEMTGQLYFILYSDNLRDLHDNYWSYNDSNYLVFGPYQVDGTSPDFRLSTVVSSNAAYNCDIPKLALNVIDDLTPTNKLKMCVSYSDFCTDWEDYNATKTLSKISNFQYDGTIYKVYVSIKDEVGNVSKKEFDYKSYIKCSNRTPSGDWVGEKCSTCSSNVIVTQTRTYRDVNLGISCGVVTRDVNCNDSSGCCASTRMVCDPWGSYGACSLPCSGGTMKRTRICRYISTYDGRPCGTYTQTQMAECNREACAPYILEDSIGLVSYTCDTNDPFVTSRECDVIWEGPGGNILQNVKRSPDYGVTSWKFWCLENGKTVPYCDWESECGGFPSNNSVFKTRVNQDDFSLLGGITIYNNSHK